MRKKNIRKNKKIIAIDFFCGCGGVTYGLKKAGIKVLAGLDNDAFVKDSYEKSNKRARFFRQDILNANSTVKVVKKILKDYVFDSSVFVACAPCQPFSLHNRNHKWDKRKSLMISFVEVVENLPSRLRPTFVIAENVGEMRKRGKNVLSETRKRLKDMGYQTMPAKIINAADFGVPQNRKRLILIAAKEEFATYDDKFNWSYFYSKYKSKAPTVREAISHLPKIEANEVSKSDPLHITQKLTEKNLKRIKKITIDGGGRLMWDDEDMLDCYENHDGHKDVYGRMKWDAPAPTLTCRCISISNGRFGHPEQDRAITLREAAILQTMENFEFETPIVKTRVAKQIGNAVPPKLAQKLGKFIITLSKRIDIK